MRRPGALFTALAATALAALTLTAALDERPLAFTLGVPAAKPAAVLELGATACQGPIDVPAKFDRVRLAARGPAALRVRVQKRGRSPFLRSRPGDTGRASPVATVGEVGEGRRIAVCVENRGPGRVVLYGDRNEVVGTSDGSLNGRPTNTDLRLVFERGEPRSMLSSLPDAFERASLFRPSWIGPWTFWVLLAAVGAGVPALLLHGLVRAAGADPQPPATGPPRSAAPPG